MLIKELQLSKNHWGLLLSTADKEEVGHELVDLVTTAYNNTPQGSFVNSLKEVIPSDWLAIDWDQDPDVDACVFYRKPRSGETWTGHKIQGLGHDGSRISKDKALAKIHELLLTPGWWIESSDAMRATLKKLNVPSVKDLQLLQALFNDPNLEMFDKDTYDRRLPSGTVIRETVFGYPQLRS
jgi:hypothetical protein